MHSDVLAAKLETLRRCVQRVRDRTPSSVDGLRTDYDAQDILCLNLERSVQACVDMAAHIVATGSCPTPRTMAGLFDVLEQDGIVSGPLAERLRKAVGFRNIAVHAYESLDWDIVYAIATEHLEDFVRFGLAVEALLKDAR